MAFTSKKNITSGVKRFVVVRLALVAIIVILIHPFDGHSYSFQNYYLATNNKVVLAISFIVFLSGLLLAIWARVYLGKNWGMPMAQKQSPELVTTGPYRYIRHPIYTGILLAILGSILAGAMYWFIFFVIAAPYFIYSALVEEKLMLKQFPKTFPQYKSKTKMLIPFVF